MHRLQITYEQLLETIQEGIWVIDADSNTTFVNPKMAEILGYAVEEMIGKNLFECMDEEEIRNAKRKVEDRKSGLAENHESKMKHKDGHDVYVELKTTPVTDDEGNYKGAVAGVTDVTERKKAEEALKVSEEKLSGILNNMTDTVWSITWPDFRHIYHSPSLEKLYGRPAQEFYDNPTLFKEITHPEDQHLTEKAIEQLLKEGQATRECRVVKPDGSIIWINDRSKLIYDENHQPIRVEGVAQNITARKQAEEALRESEEILRQVIDLVPHFIFAKDVHGIYLLANKAVAEVYGTTPDNLLGKSDYDFAQNTEEVDFFLECDKKVIESGTGLYGIEEPITDSKGSRRYVDTTKIPFTAATTKNPAMLAISVDITDRKKIEEALKLQVRERAAVDTFTYSVSNDLQAPLRRIEGFSEALLEECPDQLNDQARDYLNRIVTQISSMKKLTDALLQLSKVVSREIDREEVDLSALTRSYLDKLQYEEPERQLELDVTPGLITEGDPELLTLMLAKLLDNAWKFSTSKKEARIEFGNTKQDGRTVYYLKDNGVGFDMNYAEKLFAPFHKLHSENEYPGIGIGLNLAYRIISRHGGEIWAEGEEGKGACFFFTLS